MSLAWTEIGWMRTRAIVALWSRSSGLIAFSRWLITAKQWEMKCWHQIGSWEVAKNWILGNYFRAFAAISIGGASIFVLIIAWWFGKGTLGCWWERLTLENGRDGTDTLANTIRLGLWWKEAEEWESTDNCHDWKIEREREREGLCCKRKRRTNALKNVVFIISSIFPFHWLGRVQHPNKW